MRLLTAVSALAVSAPASAAEPLQKAADDWLDANTAKLRALADGVWDFAEPAFQEHKSSKLLADALEAGGFTVKRGVADMPTAFVAEFGNGSPVIAFLAEFDALPSLSQKAQPAKEPREAGKPGHGCGHNLLGTASVMAGLAVKEAMARHKLAGKVIVFGTPAEEGGGGKVYMIRAGLFAGVDACLAWHPGGDNAVNAGSCLAIRRVRFRFHGKAAHAAGSPEEGRSALDAVELMNVGSNYLREHVPQETRLHYVITNGGSRPNIVPELAEVWYYVRAPKMTAVDKVYERIKEIAQGACLMTRTTVELRDETGTFEMLPNLALSGLVQAQLTRIGAPPFDADDLRFARLLRKNAGAGADGDSDTRVLAGKVGEISTDITMGSTDVGDVSWVVPTAEFRVAAKPLGIAGHSWGFVASAGGPIGRKAALTAAKVMAGSALDLLADPSQLKGAKEEFARRTRGVTYRPTLPDGSRPPAKIDD